MKILDSQIPKLRKFLKEFIAESDIKPVSVFAAYHDDIRMPPDAERKVYIFVETQKGWPFVIEGYLVNDLPGAPFPWAMSEISSKPSLESMAHVLGTSYKIIAEAK